MKLKYFLRGFGLGILFTTIVLSISFYLKTSDRLVMTDAQIIEQAKKLGMVEKESISEESSELESKLESETERNILETSSIVLPETSEQESESLTESSSPEEESMEEIDSSSQVTQTESISEEMTTAEETIMQTQELESSSEIEKVTIAVKSGMSSEDIARVLQDNGVITNASEFNRYLVLNKYANRMRIGTYEIPLGADYETLAKIFCN